MLSEKPEVRTNEAGTKFWNASFETFEVKAVIPVTAEPGDIINYGFEAPMLVVLKDSLPVDEDAETYGTKTGLCTIASRKAGAVLFVAPKVSGGWKNCDESLFTELIANTKIHQYHEDGFAVLHNRFTHRCEGWAIRGAIFRTILFAKGEAADYVAGKLMKNIQGDWLWGPGDVTESGVVLENLSVVPDIRRRDIPVVSISNSEEINRAICANADYVKVAENDNFAEIYDEFSGRFMRWSGRLQDSVNFDAIGMVEEFAYETVTTSKENRGDDEGTETHRIGYIAYYNKGLFDGTAKPMVVAFHGGGDSAMHIAQVSEWYRVAHDHDFLLICVENHLNSTATEMKEFIGKLIEKYDVDVTRIYASGFSMGGCKSWDLYQEYPEIFAGLAPMSATFEVGLNVFGQPAHHDINQNTLVPIFYVGGEESPLPELPFQALKCLERMKYVMKVNDIMLENKEDYEKQENWTNKVWGISGDETEVFHDEVRDRDLTAQYFKSKDGVVYTSFGSVSRHGHECAYHSCEHAWQFLSRFARVDGKIVICK